MKPAASGIVTVIGAGPAGLMAAASSAALGAPTVLFERGPEAGRKLLLTGGGRCNVTNTRDTEDFISAFYGNGRFLYSALRQHANTDTMAFFTKRGVPLVKEGDGKLFPASGRASDIRDTLLDACRSAGVTLRFGERVTGLEALTGSVHQAPAFRLSTTREPEGILSAGVVLATGGLSYPATGCTGDGLRFAEKLGIDLVPARPALAPLLCKEAWVGRLAGVSVDPVRVTLTRMVAGQGETVAGHAEGALLFTHRGVSGPAILRLSRDLPKPWPSGVTFGLRVDLLPGDKREALERKLVSLLAAHPRRGAANALDGLLPASLLQAVFLTASVDPASPAGVFPKEQRGIVAGMLKALPLAIARPASYGDAMVTAGGIALGAIDPRTMEVKNTPGLFAAGELLDLDGDTGGYNLQAAFSTGILAGRSAARRAGGGS